MVVTQLFARSGANLSTIARQVINESPAAPTAGVSREAGTPTIIPASQSATRPLQE